MLIPCDGPVPNPNHYALVVGINRYSGNGVRTLQAAVGDALEFAAWLEKPEGGGLCPAHIRLILSSQYSEAEFAQNPSPLQSDIDKALEEFGVGSHAPVGARFYFYFSGHGLGVDFDDIAMLMANATGSSLDTNLGLRGYRRFFREVGAFKDLVFFIDCCRDRVDSAKPQAPTILGRPGGGHPIGEIQDFVLMGARYTGKAFEPVDQQTGERRGILTRALMEALAGGTTIDATVGAITADEIQKYVRRRVPELAADIRLKQTPDYAPPVQPILFGPVTPPPTYQILVKVATPSAGDVVLQTGAFHEIGRYPVSSLPRTIQLPQKGMYFLTQEATAIEIQLDTRDIKEQPHVCVIV